MTRLKRITNKIFGNTASTTGSPDTGAEIGQFGSAKAGTYNATADVETIQALPAYEQGWIGAVIPNQQYPTLPEMTGVNKVLSYQTGYLMQEGIPEWDSGTTYYKNSIVKYATVTTTQTTTVSIGASTGITGASVNKNTFVSQISVDGNYTFTYNGTSWLYNGIATDLNIYGITYTGTPAENDAITVTLTTTTSIGDSTLYISLTDNNINHNPLTDTTYWKEFGLGGGGGSGLEICDIGMALYVDETKGLRRYLNGQIVDVNTNTQKFLNRLLEIKSTNPEYFATENNWQSEATLNIDGCVYKFVLNYADDGETVASVRLPKYPDYVEINAGGTLPVIGNGTCIGLDVGSGAHAGLATGSGGAVGNIVWSYGKSIGSLGSDYPINASVGIATGLTTDPTKSGIQTTLKQTKLKLRYFIQIATGSETENNIINDIELNNPYSLFDSKYSDHELNNLSWLKSEGQWNAKSVYTDAYDKLLKVQNGTETVEGLSVKLSTETYTDYDFVLNTTDETFRLPLKNHTADDGNSVLTLYFYIGETVQNANLIDAGRIEEQLANKQDKCIHIIDTYQNGSSWYRVYSDGWCEQGGITSKIANNTTVNLLKAFSNNSYNLQITTLSTEIDRLQWAGAKSLTSFTITLTGGTGTRTAIWTACGYTL